MQIAGWFLGPVRRDGVWHRARDARCAARRRRHVKTHFKNQSATEGGQLISLPFYYLLHPALAISLEILHFFHECVVINLSVTSSVSMRVCRFLSLSLSLYLLFPLYVFSAMTFHLFLYFLVCATQFKTPSNSRCKLFF